MARAGRPKGTPKTGGRKRGTPNKRTEDLMERIADAMGEDWCPIVALARIAEDKQTTLDMRVKCLAEIAPYLQPKRKAVEHSAGKSLEELVMGNALPEQMKAARARVAKDAADRIVAEVGRPVMQVVTGVPEVDPDPEAPKGEPAQQPTPAPAEPVCNPPPRLTAITESMAPTPGQDFDPYA